MNHLNNNLLCVVDVETTGTVAGYHDIIEVCVLPLNRQLKPTKEIFPFHLALEPKRPENIDFDALKVNRYYEVHTGHGSVAKKKSEVLKASLDGCDPYRAADLFFEWFERLKLPYNKRIMPVAHNWVFDRSFIIDWLGPKTYEMTFDPRYRDTMVFSLYENDIADYRGENCPYPKNNLEYVVNQLQIEKSVQHNALDDCLVTAEVYRRMIQKSMF